MDWRAFIGGIARGLGAARLAARARQELPRYLYLSRCREGLRPSRNAGDATVQKLLICRHSPERPPIGSATGRSHHSSGTKFPPAEPADPPVC